MDSKKTIRQFINPNWVATIILCVIPFLLPFGILVLLFYALPTAIRAKKSIEKLGDNLDLAAKEMTAPSAKRLMNGRLILTDHYMFCKRTGYIFSYDEIAWVYKHRFTQRIFFIPIKITDSIYLATKTMKARQVVGMGKDKLDEIKTALIEIYNHNNACLIGYSKENQVAYKQLTK